MTRAWGTIRRAIVVADVVVSLGERKEEARGLGSRKYALFARQRFERPEVGVIRREGLELRQVVACPDIARAYFERPAISVDRVRQPALPCQRDGQLAKRLRAAGIESSSLLQARDGGSASIPSLQDCPQDPMGVRIAGADLKHTPACGLGFPKPPRRHAAREASASRPAGSVLI